MVEDQATPEYENLLKKHLALEKELEDKNQVLYDYERQKKTLEAAVAFCQEEIKTLQNNESTEIKKLQSKIQQLEETILTLKNSHEEEINCLQKELEAKDEEILEAKQKLEDIIKISTTQQGAIVEDEKLLNENHELKEKNMVLIEHVEALEKTSEDKDKQNSLLQETIKQFKSELDDYKEILSCKKADLDEADTLIQTLKDDYTCLKTELDLLKSKPLDDKSRGNSLFAEVDDRRVQLQENMNSMKSKFLEMKHERSSHLKQIAILRTQNSALLARWQAEVIDAKEDEEMILQSYKNQIQALEALIKDYKNQLEEKTASGFESSDAVAKFFDKMLITKNKEIDNLRQTLQSRALNETLLSHDLANAKKANRKCNLNILKLQNDIGQLKVQIEQMQLHNTREKPLQEFPESTVNELSQDESNKENNCLIKKITELKSRIEKEVYEAKNSQKIDCHQGTDKKVHFSENTIDPNVTDRNKMRRGVKIVQSKPIYVSSVVSKESD